MKRLLAVCVALSMLLCGCVGQICKVDISEGMTGSIVINIGYNEQALDTIIEMSEGEESPINKADMEKFTGDSFRDLTRIARINDLMWSELFVANKGALLEQMDLFIEKFQELKEMLAAEDVDGMRKMMRHSTERRALFDKK